MIDANLTCAAPLRAFCCALSSVASSLPGSVGLLHAGFIVRPTTVYIIPKALWNTNLSVAECSKRSLLNEVCSKYVALLQMLCSDVGHGFSISKVGGAPKDFWVARAWERASCLLSWGSEIPCLGPTRREFVVKTVFLQEMHIHCGLSFFPKNVIVLRNPVEEFVWTGWIFCSKSKSGNKTTHQQPHLTQWRFGRPLPQSPLASQVF